MKSLDLFALFLGDPRLPTHGTDELESQFVEQGTLRAVLPKEEGKDSLFGGLVVLFHIAGQVEGQEEMNSLVLPGEEARTAKVSYDHRQEVLMERVKTL